MPMNLYEALWIFVIYAVIGWCVEVAYAALNEGTFVNRGFLNGPYCPIYGSGMLIVAAVLTPIKENLLVLFVSSCLLTTLLEYITGLVLEKAFGHRWWDYSNIPFNIQGYVCLKFSVLWGLGCLFIMDVVHPVICRLIRWIPETVGMVILGIVLSAFLVDVCVTVNTVLKFNRKLIAMEKMAAAIHRLSDDIGEDIFEKVSAAAVRSEDLQSEWKEKRAEVEALKAEYRAMLEKRHFGFARLAKAFPGMKSRRRNEILQQYKHILKSRRKKDERTSQ